MPDPLPTAPVVLIHRYTRKPRTVCGGTWPGDTHKALHTARFLCPGCHNAEDKGA